MKTIYIDKITGNILEELKPSLGSTEEKLRLTIKTLFEDGYNLDELCSYLTKTVISEICSCDFINAINIIEHQKQI